MDFYLPFTKNVLNAKLVCVATSELNLVARFVNIWNWPKTIHKICIFIVSGDRTLRERERELHERNVFVYVIVDKINKGGRDVIGHMSITFGASVDFIIT